MQLIPHPHSPQLPVTRSKVMLSSILPSVEFAPWRERVLHGGNRRFGVKLQMRSSSFPETNGKAKAPENGWLEDDISFWGGLFSGANC